MNQEEFNKEQEGYLTQMREIKKQKPKWDNASLTYTTDDFKKLIEEGKIPKELGEWHLARIEEENRKFKTWQKWIEENPDIPIKDRAERFYGPLPKTLSPLETLGCYQAVVNEAQIYELLQKAKNTRCGLEAANLVEQSEEHELPELFNGIAPDEYGVPRLIADPLNNLYKMLDNFTKPKLVDKDGIYATEATCTNTKKETIKLVYRLQAANKEEAEIKRKGFIEKIKGRQKKIFQACWKMANKKRNRRPTCLLTELMSEAYPGRKITSFTTKEKLVFFLDLLDLSSQIQFSVTPSTDAKKKTDCYVLPFVTILKTSAYNLLSEKDCEKYPNSLTFSVLDNPLYTEERMYHVGTGIKNNTLELPNEFMLFDEYIQVRKSQLMSEEFIVFKDRDELLKLAGLKNNRMADRRLLGRCARLQEMGHILDYTNPVTFPFRIRIREKNTASKSKT